jgi:hypothetical protein
VSFHLLQSLLLWAATFDTPERFVTVSSRVAVLLASCTLRDVFLVYPGRFYANLEGRCIIYVFVIASRFQVDEKQVEVFFCYSVMNVYYVVNHVSQVEQFLGDILHICRVVKVFEDYSVCPL